MRRYYTDQLKEEAVKLAESVGVVKAANDTSVLALETSGDGKEATRIPLLKRVMGLSSLPLRKKT